MAIRISEAGYWSGLAAAAATAAYVVVQVLQVAGLLRFPADEVLIYGSSLCIVVPFILEMVAFHHLTTGDARYWTHAALVFTVIYAVFVTANYVVQLATVIPARLRGAGDTLRLLEQTPHSLFWDYDAIGYIAMGLATLVAIPALGSAGVERGVRRSFIAHAAVTPLIAVVYFAPTFSTTLLFLGLPWAVTAPLFMWMLARLLRTRTGPRGEVSA
jgi:heme/copper-type cytochrome/quinol oxidase subunit 4